MIQLRVIEERIAHLLFPMNASCMGCKKDEPLSDLLLCEDCESELVAISGRVCQRCGHGLDAHRSGSICRSCITADFSFESVHSCFEYTDTLKQMIHHMKYGDQTYYARYFAKHLATYYHGLTLPIEAVLSVPTHFEKKWEKGYHAAELLTQFFCEETGVENISHIIEKIRATAPQATLSGSDRRLNLKGAFRCDYDLGALESVLVIDDIFTTGSTIHEVAKVLKKSGVQNVYGLTLATGKRD
jgi:ComF family protein